MIIRHKSKGWAKSWGIKNLCWLSLFIMGACTTTDSFLGPKYNENMPYRLIKNVPFYPQTDFQCGPSSLAGVLNYYGKHISPSQIAEQIFDEKIRGTLSIDMALYARDQGFVAEWYTGAVKDLRENIDNNLPLIAMIDLGVGPVQRPHFLVVVGYDSKGVIVNSGGDQHKIIPWNRFQNQWSRTSLWTLRIHPDSFS
jgi:ABC-type bacteriocin/lantibiotic exporter with double-glycine peptidase domain